MRWPMTRRAVAALVILGACTVPGILGGAGCAAPTFDFSEIQRQGVVDVHKPGAHLRGIVIELKELVQRSRIGPKSFGPVARNDDRLLRRFEELREAFAPRVTDPIEADLNEIAEGGLA